jgi:hypothetical protein
VVRYYTVLNDHPGLKMVWAVRRDTFDEAFIEFVDGLEKVRYRIK